MITSSDKLVKTFEQTYFDSKVLGLGFRDIGDLHAVTPKYRVSTLHKTLPNLSYHLP